ncbi:MAG: Nif3-like dinuclear metal center hexameric protein [Planctomycetota bacterium]|nr:Nif3-like dinuclear metal center hexameric protein [Planctomycetota bacterium]
MGGLIRVRDVVAAMERIAPPGLALSGDPAGLHAGDLETPVRRILVSLDASYDALRRAKRDRCGMLVVHHPLFYRGLKSLAENDPAGRLATTVARSGFAVYSAHTCLDLAEGGVNDCLARTAGLAETTIMQPIKGEKLLKLAVFTPVSSIEKVRRALCSAGAGHIGRYSDCTFRVRGTGTFRCGSGTKPFQGRPGSFEEADEYRLETVFGEFSADRVIDAMLAAHPYEEVAYDLYPLQGQARTYGFGRVGELSEPEFLAPLAGRLARTVGSGMAQYRGNPRRLVRRLAVWAGGGIDVKSAIDSRADALAAGEIGYHDGETLTDAGLALITLGHGYSEYPVLRPLAGRLEKELGGRAAIVVALGGTTSRNV